MTPPEVTLIRSRRIRPVFVVGTEVDCARCGHGAVVMGEPAFYSVAMTNDAGYVQLHSVPVNPNRPVAPGGSNCDTRLLSVTP